MKKTDNTLYLQLRTSYLTSTFRGLRGLFFLVAVSLPLLVMAQPQARRNQQQKQTSAANNMTNRAKISFPSDMSMDENVIWRRDLYREINLMDDANAGLYYPVAPQGTQMNLFTYIFKLMLSGQLKCYEYKLDNTEVFTDSARIKPLRFLNDYHIFYEKAANGRIRLDNSDIPSAEVKRYYIKESAYYDQKSATFHTKVLALCPIMEREEEWSDNIMTQKTVTSDDEFGGESMKAPVQSYPLFWVKYDDLAPFLSKQTLMTSNLNNAATMSIDDFFTKNMYKGKIYKTVNMQGRMLNDYCKTDSAMKKEQDRIEKEIKAFEISVFGDPAKKDSLDSIAKAQGADKKAKKQKKNRRDNTADKSTKQKTVKAKATPSSGATVTVRRQRH
ncbi:MAG: gliding motility protein GldN [Bacteroidaceae bacterium]|nr:gliding motility protein GldN [Bacteroidaceae bacterium]